MSTFPGIPPAPTPAGDETPTGPAALRAPQAPKQPVVGTGPASEGVRDIGGTTPAPSADKAGQKPLTFGGGEPAAADGNAQMPLTFGASEPGPGEMAVSEEQFMHEFMREQHTLPIAALLAGVGAVVAFHAAPFVAQSNLAGAVTALLGVVVAVGIGSLVASGVGWMVARMFGDDYGSAGLLILRYTAVTALGNAVLQVLTSLVDPFIALAVSTPIMVAIVVLVAGVDILRAVIFCSIMFAVWFTFVFMILGAVGIALFSA